MDVLTKRKHKHVSTDDKHVCSTTQTEKENTESKQYLSDMSPKDKPWDIRRAETDAVQTIYAQSQEFERYAQRMEECSGLLFFGWQTNIETGESNLKLRSAQFCHVRHCPVCQWRRTLMWAARFYQALPEVIASFPKSRWVFLTLTLRNCEIIDLRSTLENMGKSWQRFIKRKEFSRVQGWMRTTEVTRGEDGSAHPHYHVLMMVSPSWFTRGYVKQSRWVEIWGECLKVNYAPNVDIRAINPDKKRNGTLGGAIAETFKYSVKAADMFKDDFWMLELTRQVHKMRFIASGGALKNILKAEQETDADLALLSESESENETDKAQLAFGWKTKEKRYKRTKSET
jgi:plasmid rolling circle replication initiator protein Rep